MPRYFFDLEGEPQDATGIVFPDIDAVRRAAKMSLPQLLSDRIKEPGQGAPIAMTVRDEWDRAVLSVTLLWTIRRVSVDVSRVYPRSARASVDRSE